MRRFIQPGSRLLLGYYLALPFLFSYHTCSHQHHHQPEQEHEHGVELAITQNEDCAVCDLYHNQTAVLSDLVNHGSPSPDYLFPQVDLDNTLFASSYTLHLRGPPID